MKYFSFFIEYEINKTRFKETALNHRHYTVEFTADDDSLKLSLKTTMPLDLKRIGVTYERGFVQSENERFFANGYQSWSLTREYAYNDFQNGISPIAKRFASLNAMVTASGDYNFVEYPAKGGLFHGYTYCYFRRRARFDFFGSLNEKQGFTIFRRDMTGQTFTIEKEIDGVTVDGEYEVFDIVSYTGDEERTYEKIFDKYFEKLNIGTPRLKGMTGYTSWYNYKQNIDESIILRDLAGMKKALGHASVFQIDDGYETKVGDWLEPDAAKFPNGLASVAEKIHEAGFVAGLWLAPFCAQKDSKIAADHPDWLIKDPATGKPLVGAAAWGGAYVLDFYHPEVRDYIKSVFDNILGSWKFDMLKLDFLYTQCIIPRRNKSRGTVMREAMEFLRECAGDKLILGCGVPLGSAFGLVDACRTGCDTGLAYKALYNNITINAEVVSTQNSIINTVFRRHLNGRAFCSDPDVFFLREDNVKYTENQKLMLARVNNLLGGVMFVSDDVGAYNDAQFDVLIKAFTKGNASIWAGEILPQDRIRLIFEEDGMRKVILFSLKNAKIDSESSVAIERDPIIKAGLTKIRKKED